MKKFGLIIAGIVAAIIALANLGSLLALAISAGMVVAAMHYYPSARKTWKKVVLLLIGLSGLVTGIANIPGFIGIAAIIAVLYIYRAWQKEKSSPSLHHADPFQHFESQWKEITK
ncbi:ABC transporter permease [Paenisporosarcina cavernae]|uniref:ABC transporter permease n=1 Tax=Paenisporosarcina cavernae TaxID=2320858 RepID=A0A385YQL7_9BACL|nr:ABC transporter permease [Paenisporosarcina cavernae]AYC28660.1 ABC transporter permease [Paenisporosarcina cavernae]